MSKVQDINRINLHSIPLHTAITKDFITVVGMRIMFGFFSISAITYVLFQKKLLPKSITKLVARLFFYPTFPITALLRLNNYWTQIDDSLILGCAPMNILGHPDALYRLGVRGVINMCDEYGGPQERYDSLGIKQLRLMTVDHFEPSVSHMQEAVKFIAAMQKKNERVYVHCKAGHGRAAAIALCWQLHKNPELSAQDANTLLHKKRKVRKTLYKQPNVVAFANALAQENAKLNVGTS